MDSVGRYHPIFRWQAREEDPATNNKIILTHVAFKGPNAFLDIKLILRSPDWEFIDECLSAISLSNTDSKPSIL